MRVGRASAAMVAGLWLPALLTLLPTPLRCVRPHDRRLELLRLALRRDREWQLVFQQRIKPAADVQLSCYDPDHTTPLRRLIQRSVRWFSWCGSRIECATRVMGQAFACVVYEHLSLVTEIIDGLQTKTGADAIRSHSDAYRQMGYAAIMLADKMAAADGGTGRLNALADLSVESFRALANGAGENPPLAEIRLMRQRIDRFVDERCVRPESVDIYKGLGFTAVVGSPFHDRATGEKLSIAVAHVVKKLFVYYDGLRIETMPVDAWAHVFDYRVPNALALPIGASFETENAGSGTVTGNSTGTPGTGCHCLPCGTATVEGTGTKSTINEIVTGDGTDTHGIGYNVQVCDTEIVEDTVTDDGRGTNGTEYNGHACDTATVENTNADTNSTNNDNGTVTGDSTGAHGTERNCHDCGIANGVGTDTSGTGNDTVTGDNRNAHCNCDACGTVTVEDTGTDTKDSFTGNRTDKDGTGDIIHSVPT